MYKTIARQALRAALMQVTSHSCMQEEARSRHHGLSVWIGLVSTHMPPLSVPQARVLVHDVGQSWRGPDTAALVCAASHPSCTRRLRQPHPPVAGRAMGTQGSNGREQTCPAGQIVSGFRATEQADFLSTLEFECSLANTLRFQRLEFGRKKITQGPNVIRPACCHRQRSLPPSQPPLQPGRGLASRPLAGPGAPPPGSHGVAPWGALPAALWHNSG